jgi:quercetin dioxygenase-like cupin family protein
MIRLASTLTLLLAIAPSPALAAATHSVTMKALATEGDDQEVVHLLGEKNLTIAQVILRNGKTMDEHSVEEPATIHCVSGSGVLIDEDGRHIPLQTGVVVVLPPGKKHVVKATPEISVLVTRFAQPKKPAGREGKMGMGSGRRGSGGGMRPPGQ